MPKSAGATTRRSVVSAITQKLLPKLKPGAVIGGYQMESPYEVRDAKIKGFLIRVQPSGVRSYVCQYGRGKRITIGSVDVKTLESARLIAKSILNETDQSKIKSHVAPPKDKTTELTLREFLDDHYNEYLKTNLKRGAETVTRLQNDFDEFLDLPLKNIDTWKLEKWRTNRKKMGRTAATINRAVQPLKTALTRATGWKLIDENPLGELKRLKTPKETRVRYLSEDENQALRTALDNREQQLREGRENSNLWRKQRGYRLKKTYSEHYVDGVKPIVLLALNTGMRRGEIFSLEWNDINLKEKYLTVRAVVAKGNQERHIPLNVEVQNMLKTWREQSKGTLVFPNRQGERRDNIRKVWGTLLKEAKITNFRFHDLRHTFASNLVMRNIPLNTVSELLGHQDLQTTRRYAHLAPDHLADAVNVLDAPRVSDIDEMKLNA